MTESIHDDLRRKPINKQAALITRKASELLLHKPPPEPAKRLPTQAEQQQVALATLRAAIVAKEVAGRERLARRAALRAAKPAKQPKWKHMWAARFLKQQAKSRGLPPPTTEEIRAFRKSQPNYGKPL